MLEDDSSHHSDDCGPQSCSLLGAILLPSPQSHNRGRSAALPHQTRPPPPRRYHTAIPRGQLQVPQRGLACNEGLRRGPEWTSAGRDFQSGGKAVIVRVFSITVTNQTEKKTRQAGVSMAGSFQILQGQTQWQKFQFLLPLFCMSSSRLVGGRQEGRQQKIGFLLSSSESSTFYMVEGERQGSAVC